jgi:hypothetical protein
VSQCSVVIVGREVTDGTRFLAVSDPEDSKLPFRFITEDPLGWTIEVDPSPQGNRFRLL